MVVNTKITIDGVTRNDDCEKIKVRKSISENNSSSSFSLEYNNVNGRNKSIANIGDEVVIFADIDTDPATTKLFVGLVENIEFLGKPSTREKLIISGRDYSARLQDATVEPVVYNDSEISTIVTDIISNNVSDITTTNVAVTPTTVTHIAFNHTPVFDALKQLAKLTNFYFYVDEDKDLHFEQKGTTHTSVVLDSDNILSSTVRQVDREMANSVWVYGSRILTGTQNTFTADGGSVYTLDDKPHNTEILVAGSTAPKKGGVFQFLVGNVGSPTQYLVDFDAKKVIFVSGTDPGDNIPVSGTDSITVNYDRLTPIVKFGEDKISIANYGPKTKVIVDKDITNPNAAKDRLVQELSEFSSPIIQAEVKCNSVLSVTPGATITLDQPNQGIDSQVYEILEAVYEFTPKQVQSQNVLTLRLNKRIIDLADTIKQIKLDLKKVQTSDISNSDTITRVEFATGSYGFRVSEWFIKTRNIEHAFVLGHNNNGVIGSPAPAQNGSQVVLGSATAGAFTAVRSGGTWT